MDPLVGKTFADRYLIEERVGSGAMGEVYRARHVKFGKLFAVKVLRAELLKNEKIRKRFDREAELAGTLKHPNIVGIVDVGETPEGVRYLVMEMAAGESLTELIAQGPLPPARAIPLLRQLCDALHHAHDRGLVHRDFKPDNVIVEQRHDGLFPRIIDFGIAILRDDLSSSDGERLTTSGVILGTPQYLAPEQAFGSGDHRIDLFALGVVSYEMLTGRLPYDGEGAEVARANMTMATPPFGVRVPTLDVDPLLEAFTLQLMSKSPELRPESGKHARELLDLIESDRSAAAELLGIDLAIERRALGRTEESQPVVRVAIGDTLESLPVGRALSIAPSPPSRSRRAWVVAGSAAVVLALGAVVIVASTSSDDGPVAAAPAPRAPDPKPAAPDPTPDSTPVPEPPAPPPPPPKPTPVKPTPVKPTPVKPTPVKPTPVKPTPVKPTPVIPAPVEPTPVPTPTPKTQPPVWESTKDEISPKELADLYVAVGRDLKRYADNKGANSETLSYRFRLIKLADSLATSDRRRATSRELQSIRAAAK